MAESNSTGATVTMAAETYDAVPGSRDTTPAQAGVFHCNHQKNRMAIEDASLYP